MKRLPALEGGPAPPRSPARGEAWPAVLLAVVSSALCLLVVVGAETVARVVDPGYLVERRGLHVYSDTLGWAARKSASAVLEGKRVTTNAQGYRGHALSLPKPRATTRVVVLGDSIAFGLGVDDGETFADLLQAHDNGLEVGNLAVQGYGPAQSLLVLTGEGLRAQPDVVVLAFCMDNDFADALLSVALYDGRWHQPRFLLEGDRLALDRSGLGLGPTQRVVQWLSDYSHLFNRVSTLPPVDSAGGKHWTDRKREALRDEAYALRVNLAIVRRIDALCRERGIGFLLAAFPHWFTYRPTKPWLPEQFLKALRAEGITVLDMWERFTARGETFHQVALDGAGHLSPRGHAIAAQELESAVRALVPGSEPNVAARQGLSGRTGRRSP